LIRITLGFDDVRFDAQCRLTYLYMSAPLIAIGYLIWKGTDSIAAG
jgi:hypothetical protein